MTVLHEAPTHSNSRGAGSRRSGTDARRRGDERRAGDAENTRRSRRARIESERATRSKAAQRALDRRRRRMATGTPAPRGGLSISSVSFRERLQHTPFVVPVLALLIVGLGLSLWLSTKAAQDSYRLGVERAENQALVDQRDALKRDYESGNSAPELAREATRLGMIPAQNPARMIVEDPRRPKIVGKPAPASGKPMVDLNPQPTPDPTEKIDPKQVDDSIGLGGSAVPAPANPTTPAPQAGQPAPAAPGSGAAPTGPSANPAPQNQNPAQPNPVPQNVVPQNPPPPNPAPQPSSPVPAPNVVPRT
ncbi:hypothetical protein [Gordonia aurantiaca]|uniref:hypothetical protein n=1 Tax=Gordonia sp. B21 TaxID=3151852 RepID=UPI003266CF6D